MMDRTDDACGNMKPGNYSAATPPPLCTLLVDHEGPHRAVLPWTGGTVEHEWGRGVTKTMYQRLQPQGDA
jgi:hypothetical protein